MGDTTEEMLEMHREHGDKDDDANKSMIGMNRQRNKCNLMPKGLRHLICINTTSTLPNQLHQHLQAQKDMSKLDLLLVNDAFGLQ